MDICARLCKKVFVNMVDRRTDDAFRNAGRVRSEHFVVAGVVRFVAKESP